MVDDFVERIGGERLAKMERREAVKGAVERAGCDHASAGEGQGVLYLEVAR
jgi:hypothetical protein